VRHGLADQLRSTPQTDDDSADDDQRPHNPKVGGSNPPPATNGFSGSRREPTIPWSFVLFRRTSTGVFTGLIGTYSALESGSRHRVCRCFLRSLLTTISGHY
jgi:hypothetical protein